MTTKRPTLTLNHDTAPARPRTAAKTIRPAPSAKHAWADAALREAFAKANEPSNA